MKANRALNKNRKFAGVGIPLEAPGGTLKPPAKAPYKRIATEEAWITPEIMRGYRDSIS